MLIAAVMSAVVTSRRRSARARTSMPSMPSVPLISASPSFSARVTGARPAAARASAAGRDAPVVVPDGALADQGQRAGRQRGEVAGAAEAAVLVHHRGEPGVQQGHVGQQGLGPDAGPAGGQGGDAQQHQAPGRPLAPPRGRNRPRGSGPGCAAAGSGTRPGCAGWPGRRSRSRCRSGAGRRRRAPRRRRGCGGPRSVRRRPPSRWPRAAPRPAPPPDWAVRGPPRPPGSSAS